MQRKTHRSSARHVCFWALLATFTVACQDAVLPTDPFVGDPSFVVLDGANNEGNPRFFFLPPLALAQEFIGVLDTDLEVQVEFCDLGDIEEPDDDDQDEVTFADLTVDTPCIGALRPLGPATFTGDHYQLDWRAPEEGTFRLFARVGATALGLVDVQIDDDEVRGSAGVFWIDDEDDEDDDNGTIPVRFRIEEGALCATPIPDEELGMRECTAQSVEASEGASVTTIVESTDGSEDVVTVGVVVPPQDPDEVPDFTIVIEQCLDGSEPTDLDIDIPTFGGCVDINAFDVSGELIPPLSEPAVVFICIDSPGLGGALTSADGIASTAWTLSETAGTYELVASGFGISDGPLPFTPTPDEGAPGAEDDIGDAVTLEEGMLSFTARAHLGILIYGPSMLAPSEFRPDNEQTFTEAEGFTVTVADALESELTTAQFASFSAIVFGDRATNLAVLGAAEDNKADWSAAITGQ